MHPPVEEVHRLANLLEAVVPADRRVSMTWAWKPAADEFIPDVMVHTTPTQPARFTSVPDLAVEVLSAVLDFGIARLGIDLDRLCADLSAARTGRRTVIGSRHDATR